MHMYVILVTLPIQFYHMHYNVRHIALLIVAISMLVNLCSIRSVGGSRGSDLFMSLNESPDHLYHYQYYVDVELIRSLQPV